MKRDPATSGPDAIELVEEAVHLLRLAPAGALMFYAIGTLPFVLAFLYFWAEMSHGAFAREHAASGALGMALLYIWMKSWQAVFVSALRAQVMGRSEGAWGIKRAARLVLAQAALQPIGLFAVPAASLIVLPAGWAFSYFQNVTVLGDGSVGLGEASKKAAMQASLQPERAYLVMGIVAIFALFVWLNIAIFMAMLPFLLKSLLGMDNAYTRAGILNVLNTTYLASTFALAYLCVDPLAKAASALRCFYGQSRKTAEDLLMDLSRARAKILPALVIAVCLAQNVSAAPAEKGVTPTQLNEAIDEVQKQPQFAWRMPRVEKDDADDAQSSWLVRMLHAGAQALMDGIKWVGRQIADAATYIWKLIRKLWPNETDPDISSRSHANWLPLLQALLLIMIIVIAAFLGVVIFRMIKQREAKPVVMTEVVQAKPDLRDENVTADQNSEDGWLAMGRELMTQGQLRLALRAFYLAGLAHLAAREFIGIAMFKSNHEYELELRRRARAGPAILGAFSENVEIFDRVWYGLHDINDEMVRRFEENLGQIRAG